MTRIITISLYFLSAITLLLVWSSCANKVSPAGGDKDVKPPEITSISPSNFSTGFNTQKVRITFDEYFTLKEIGKQLVISPIIRPLPEFTIKKKTLNIALSDSLISNTTYTINFGSAIVDITEGNALENFQYVFSTGSFIDSMLVRGKVMNASTLETEKGILVMLYNDLSDSVPSKRLPDYFGRTNENGQFLINNLKSGTYRLIALKDNNNNYLYDLPDEQIGFVSDKITLPDSMPRKIMMSNPYPSKLKLKQAGTNGYNIVRLLFNRPAEKITLTDLQGKNHKNIIYEYSLYKDTVQLFITDTVRDSLQLVIHEGSTVVDTASVLLRKSTSESRGRGNILGKLRVENNTKNGILDQGRNLKLYVDYPLKRIDKSRMVFTTDSLQISNVEYLLDSAKQRSISIETKLYEGKKYKLTLLPGAVTNILDQSNDTIKLNIVLRSLKEYGSLTIEFDPAEQSGSFIIQLVDDKDKMKQQQFVSGKGAYIFNNLNPGVYRIKVIFDENQNRKSDPGNYWVNLQPEKVDYYSDVVKIRANWDVSVSWELSKK